MKRRANAGPHGPLNGCVVLVMIMASIAGAGDADARSFNDVMRHAGFRWSDGYHVRSRCCGGPCADVPFGNPPIQGAMPEMVPSPQPAPGVPSPSDRIGGRRWRVR
ncbi:MAG: hypothetical protein FJ297_17905 [Planctomycetes bacterium]|nr:hypothetical protein [Planctomycetota bacterium]